MVDAYPRVLMMGTLQSSETPCFIGANAMFFSAPDNSSRAAWAQAAVNAFMAACLTDREDAIPDLIADLLHLARCDGHDDPVALLDRARMNFEAEEQEEQDDDREAQRSLADLEQARRDAR
jgi:hypothetical protein